MAFISLLIALGVVQVLGSGAPLHRDQWFYQLLSWLKEQTFLPPAAGSHLFLALVIPLLVLALVLLLVELLFPAGWGILVSIPVLLYSLGRGDFSRLTSDYLDAWHRQDSAAAANVIAELEGSDSELASVDDWADMHEQALRAIAYRGFERMFAVVFWFLLCGPGGALLYRLSVLYNQAAIETAEDAEDRDDREESDLPSRWLWILEWPAIRLLGLSWAMVGNFSGCIQQWKNCLFCARRPSEDVLQHYLSGAMGVGPSRSKSGALEVTELAMEVESLQSLLTRSLLLWLCVIALFSLFS